MYSVDTGVKVTEFANFTSKGLWNVQYMGKMRRYLMSSAITDIASKTESNAPTIRAPRILIFT